MRPANTRAFTLMEIMISMTLFTVISITTATPMTVKRSA